MKLSCMLNVLYFEPRTQVRRETVIRNQYQTNNNLL